MEIYRDFYGCVACVRKFKNGSARLTIRDTRGKLFKNGNYKTYRGAKVAMTKCGDGWNRV